MKCYYNPILNNIDNQRGVHKNEDEGTVDINVSPSPTTNIKIAETLAQEINNNFKNFNVEAEVTSIGTGARLGVKISELYMQSVDIKHAMDNGLPREQAKEMLDEVVARKFTDIKSVQNNHTHPLEPSSKNYDFYEDLFSPRLEDIKEDISVSLAETNNKVAKFLEDNFGFSYVEMATLEDVTRYNIVGATDFLEKIIYAKEGREEDVYTIEAGYVITKLLGVKNLLRKQLISNIHLLEDYQERYDKIFVLRDREKFPENYVREVILADYIASELAKTHREVRKGEYKYESSDVTAKNKLQYYVLRLKHLWSQFLTKVFKKKQRNFVKNAVSEIVDSILENNTRFFNTSSGTTPVEIKINDTQKSIKKVLEDLGGAVSGSYALSRQGSLFRENEMAGDIDFFFPFNAKKTVLEKTKGTFFNKGEYITEGSILEDIVSKFEDAEIVAVFGGVFGEKVLTARIKIGEEYLDIFLPQEDIAQETIIELDGERLHFWKNIFDAKARIGSKKHLSDLAGFTSTLPTGKTDIRGQRHYNFRAYIPVVRNSIQQIQNFEQEHGRRPNEAESANIYSDVLGDESTSDDIDIEIVRSFVDEILENNTSQESIVQESIIQESIIQESIIQESIIQESIIQESISQEIQNIYIGEYPTTTFDRNKKIKKANKPVKSSRKRKESDNKILEKNSRRKDFKYLNNILEVLSHKFDIPFEVIDDSRDQRAGWVDRSNVENPIVIINLAYSNSETPLHEYSHIFIDMIRRGHKRLYSSMIKEIDRSPLGKEIRESLLKQSPNMTEEHLTEETIATLLGKLSLQEVDTSTGLHKTIKKLWKSIIEFIEKTFDVKISNIPVSTPLVDLAKMLVDPNTRFSHEITSFKDEYFESFEVEIDGKLMEFGIAIHNYGNGTIGVSFDLRQARHYETLNKGLFFKVLHPVIDSISKHFQNVQYDEISFVPISNSGDQKNMRIKGYNLFAKRLFGRFSIVKEGEEGETTIPIPDMFQNYGNLARTDIEQTLKMDETASIPMENRTFEDAMNNPVTEINLFC